MNSGTQARADWRVLISAALIGSGVGLGVGAAYLAGGLGHTAPDPARAAARAAMESAMLQRENATLQPEAVRLTSLTGAAAGAPVVERLAETPHKRRGGYSSELECLTEAVYYEARGETFQGQAAVAQVVMNRVRHPAFPKTVCEVVFQGANRRTGCQFSFACDGSMSAHREAKAWARARKIAARTLAGVVLADVGSATHFHTTAVSPAWGQQMRKVGQVGLHVFYRFNSRKKAAPVAPPETVLASLAAAPAEPPAEIRLTSAVIEASPQAADAAKPADAKAKAVELAPTPEGVDAAALAPAPSTTVGS